MKAYTDYPGLPYFNTKHKLNSRQASCYLQLSKFTCHIHYRLAFKIGKLDDLSRHSMVEKSTMHIHFFDKEQVMDIKNDDLTEEEDTQDVELEGIDMARWEKRNGLWVVLLEHKREIFC